MNAKSGVTYNYYKATHQAGNKNPVGYGAVYMKHPKKLDTLLEYGYDLMLACLFHGLTSKWPEEDLFAGA